MPRAAWLALLLALAVLAPSAGAAPKAAPRCFGAASRDPEHACHNAQLRLLVRPTPEVAEITPTAPCAVTQSTDQLVVCVSGAAPAKAVQTVALIGDSHAGHWRAALGTIAATRDWTIVSLTHSGCPFSAAERNLPAAQSRACDRWYTEVLGYLAAHPEITTVFVSAITGGTGAVPEPGTDEFRTQIDGFTKAWAALPAAVTRIYVLRDTPKVHVATAACVDRAIRRHEPAGPACAVARDDALDPDAEAVAAGALRSSRVGVLDLTAHLCDAKRCFPVVGGSLVFKDQTHLTSVFSATLGPYVRRAIDRCRVACWTAGLRAGA
jgi:hypothetical protein